MTTELPIRWVRDRGDVHSASADLSASGIFFRTDEPAEVGELLHFECDMPDGPLGLIVAVRHVSDAPERRGFGVALLADNTASAQRWQRFCAGLLAGETG